MNAYQKFALDWFLYSYPEDKTYDEVIQMLRDYHPDVEPWQSFVDMEVDEMVEFIDTMSEQMSKRFVPREGA